MEQDSLSKAKWEYDARGEEWDVRYHLVDESAPSAVFLGGVSE